MLYFVFLSLILIESIHTQIFPDLYQYIPDLYQLYKKKKTLTVIVVCKLSLHGLDFVLLLPENFSIYLTLLWVVIRDVLGGDKASSARS